MYRVFFIDENNICVDEFIVYGIDKVFELANTYYKDMRVKFLQMKKS